MWEYWNVLRRLEKISIKETQGTATLYNNNNKTKIPMLKDCF